MTQATFLIAGIPFALQLPDRQVAEVLAEAWVEFRTRERPVLTLEAQLGGDPPPYAQTRDLPQGAPRPAGGLQLSAEGIEAELDAAVAQGRMRVPPDAFAVACVVKVALAARLALQGGLLVHGVGVAARQSAAVFTGDSGAGKSTLGAQASLAELTLLGDELVALVPGREAVLALGTPWNVGTAATAPVRYVGTLAHAATPALRPQPGADVLRVLLRNCVLADGSAQGRAGLFQAASALLVRVQTACFAFAPEASAGHALRRYLDPAP